MSYKLNKAFSLFILGSTSALAQTSTVIGPVQNSVGQTLSNGSLAFTLQNCGSNPTVGSLTYTVLLDSNGNPQAAQPKVTNNSAQGCSLPSYWSVTGLNSAGQTVWQRPFIITTSTFNPSTAAPLSSVPSSAISKSSISSVLGSAPLLSSPATVWTSTGVYPVGQLVIGSDHATYASQVEANTGNDPTLATNVPSYWAQISAPSSGVSVPSSASFLGTDSTGKIVSVPAPTAASPAGSTTGALLAGGGPGNPLTADNNATLTQGQLNAIAARLKEPRTDVTHNAFGADPTGVKAKDGTAINAAIAYGIAQAQQSSGTFGHQGHVSPIYLPKGHYTLDQTIRLPRGMSIICDPGATLFFGGASGTLPGLIVYTPEMPNGVGNDVGSDSQLENYTVGDGCNFRGQGHNTTASAVETDSAVNIFRGFHVSNSAGRAFQINNSERTVFQQVSAQNVRQAMMWGGDDNESAIYDHHFISIGSTDNHFEAAPSGSGWFAWCTGNDNCVNGSFPAGGTAASPTPLLVPTHAAAEFSKSVNVVVSGGDTKGGQMMAAYKLDDATGIKIAHDYTEAVQYGSQFAANVGSSFILGGTPNKTTITGQQTQVTETYNGASHTYYSYPVASTDWFPLVYGDPVLGLKDLLGNGMENNFQPAVIIPADYVKNNFFTYAISAAGTGYVVGNTVAAGGVTLTITAVGTGGLVTALSAAYGSAGTVGAGVATTTNGAGTGFTLTTTASTSTTCPNLLKGSYEVFGTYAGWGRGKVVFASTNNRGAGAMPSGSGAYDWGTCTTPAILEDNIQSDSTGNSLTIDSVHMNNIQGTPTNGNYVYTSAQGTGPTMGEIVMGTVPGVGTDFFTQAGAAGDPAVSPRNLLTITGSTQVFVGDIPYSGAISVVHPSEILITTPSFLQPDAHYYDTYALNRDPADSSMHINERISTGAVGTIFDYPVSGSAGNIELTVANPGVFELWDTKAATYQKQFAFFNPNTQVGQYMHGLLFQNQFALLASPTTGQTKPAGRFQCFGPPASDTFGCSIESYNYANNSFNGELYVTPTDLSTSVTFHPNGGIQYPTTFYAPAGTTATPYLLTNAKPSVVVSENNSFVQFPTNPSSTSVAGNRYTISSIAHTPFTLSAPNNTIYFNGTSYGHTFTSPGAFVKLEFWLDPFGNYVSLGSQPEIGAVGTIVTGAGFGGAVTVTQSGPATIASGQLSFTTTTTGTAGSTGLTFTFPQTLAFAPKVCTVIPLNALSAAVRSFVSIPTTTGVTMTPVDAAPVGSYSYAWTCSGS